jgi:hypothetical protein
LKGNPADWELPEEAVFGHSGSQEAQARRRLGFRFLLAAYGAIVFSWVMFWLVWSVTQ